MTTLTHSVVGLLLGLWGVAGVPVLQAQSSLPADAPQALRQFDTDLSSTTIDLSELRRGAPKDAIPAIDNPTFVSIEAARDWIAPTEPVIVVEHNGVARAYPLQILTWHEIVNDTIGDTPVAVTFCPLCYSAIAFERRINGEAVTFGVSGLLRNSDLVMYDRTTETLWQQFTGEAIVGAHAGKTLKLISSQLISFRQFTKNYPGGDVLSRDTGYDRRYGQNPYAGYDDIDKPPFAFDGPTDDRLPPKEKVVAVSLGGTHKAYPHSVTKEQRVTHDAVDGRPLVVFHAPGPVSALDARRISASKEVGATGVFDRRVDGRTLRFRYVEKGRFEDTATGSVWTITGRAVEGPMKGTRLDRIPHGDYFAFSWFAFRPDGVLYEPEPES